MTPAGRAYRDGESLDSAQVTEVDNALVGDEAALMEVQLLQTRTEYGQGLQAGVGDLSHNKSC